ncbi:MAG: MgtC/SapB family protein [Allosphingosinicella sp.]
MPAVPPGSFLPGLALALAIGLLVGIERGWRMRAEEEGARVAGVRTFALLGLLGGLAGLQLAGPLRLLTLLLVAGAIVALLLGYAGDMRRDHNVSATSTLAAIATLALGAMATAGEMALASVGAGAAVSL